MGIVAISAVVIAITIVVLAAFMIPTLIEIRKSAAAVRAYLTDMESQVQPVLKELRELTANLRVLTDGIASKTDEVKCFMTAVGDTGRNISRINVVIGDFAGLLTRSSLWMTGLKAGGRYVIDRITKKRR
jgi:uncharacterized protein YoxC